MRIFVQANLDMKHLKELSDLELAAQEEKQGAIAGINSHAVDQMKLAMKRRETEFQQELLAKQEHGQASAAETDQLIVAHQQEVTTLKESLASEQQQQKKVRSITNVTLLTCCDICIGHSSRCYLIRFLNARERKASD